MPESRMRISDQETRTHEPDADACSRPRMISDPISGALPESLRRRRRRGRRRHFKRPEAFQAGRDGLGTVSKDILPKAVDGLGDLGKIGGSGGEGGDDELLDALEVVLDLLNRGEHERHGVPVRSVGWFAGTSGKGEVRLGERCAH